MDIQALNALYQMDFPERKIVTGEGNTQSPLVLIGEAPGREEEEQGRPFVGKAGKNLVEFLDKLKLNREDIYITNVVKFRPTKISDRGSVSNRTPTDTEIEEYLPYLLKELEILQPKLIVTLGNTPLHALLGKGKTVGSVHGVLCEYRGKKLYPLFHPASLIYNPSLRSTYEADIENLGKLLESGL